MFKLHARTNRLTDGGETFNVVLCDLESEGSEKSRAVMDFHAVTYADALAFMEALKVLVDVHTVDLVELRGH